MDQHPSVSEALTELLNNQRLVAALEEIMGPDPAVIEFTGITAEYGAAPQFMHQDVIPEGSAQQFSRSFAPSYSLFIPLQNTTAEMGATSICPGTHQCGSGSYAFCVDTALQASGPNNNWPLGWGALVNQQTMHMGGEHSDPNGQERVLFILTFAPRPRWNQKQVETRILGTGGSYSLHWSQWGHTLSDYANARRQMKAPYRHLRSLGLYKSRDQKWGWDFWTVALQRLAQDELGYRIDDFFNALYSGQMDWIPSSILGPKSSHGSPSKYKEAEDASPWIDFGNAVIEKSVVVTRTMHQRALLAFFGILALGNMLFYRMGIRPSFYRPIRRLFLGHVAIALVALLYARSLQRTSWARSLQQGLAFNVDISSHFYYLSNVPSALATEEDVLQTRDFQSQYLGSYTDLLDYSHGGNILWRTEVESSYQNYNQMGLSLQDNLCRELTLRIGQNGGRFLTKNVHNDWGVMSPSMAMDFCDEVLKSKANPIVGNMVKWAEYLISEFRFGYWRNAQSLSRLTIQQLQHLQQSKFLKRAAASKKRKDSPPAPYRIGSKRRLLVLKDMVSVRPSKPERHALPPRPPVQERFLGALLKVGDLVEGNYRDAGWFQGRIVGVDKYGWHVEYLDGDTDRSMCRGCVRPFVPYTEGEHAFFQIASKDYVPCEILATHPERSTLDLKILTNGNIVHDIATERIWRAIGAPVPDFGDGEDEVDYDYDYDDDDDA